MRNRIFIFSMIFAANICMQCAQQKNMLPQDDIKNYSQTIAELFQQINKKSYFPVNTQHALHKSLDAFISTDEHSHFLGPKEYKKLLQSTKGNFYGIGVAMAPKKAGDDFLTILRVVPNSPASQHNIHAFDKIIAIDGEPVSTLTTKEALAKLRSDKKHAPVKLDILRSTKSIFSVTLKRDAIKNESIRSYYIANKRMLYITIQDFTHDMGKQLRVHVKRAVTQPLQGIIIDLRNNPGGVLQEAVYCASAFLEKNSLVVITKNRDHQVLDHLSTEVSPIMTKPIPIVLLVNEFTASSAEIFAGALQDHAHKTKSRNQHIFLVGTNTHGKGTVQEVIPLDNNCALKITTSLYYLPLGRSIHQCGIAPDFIIKPTFSKPQELKIIDKMYKKPDRKKKAKSRPLLPETWQRQHTKQLQRDHQLNCAINIIETLNLGKKLNSKLVNSHEKAKEFLLKNSCWCSKLDIKMLN